jgi:alpha-1,2-mannosyltransferase
MAPLLEILRSGSWLQKDRLVFYPLLMLAITVGSTVYVLASNGGTLPNGSPFGSDFVSFWIAAREAFAGRPEVAYTADLFAQAQNAIFADGNFYAFYYPPHYLAYLLPLGALPYYAALLAWTGVTLAAALAVVTAMAGRNWRVVMLTLAFPATFLTLAHGQNAFLSAALFGGGLLLLDRRPVIAGVLFGLLTFKPQLGILIPFALLAAGHWRTILSAAVTTVLVVLVSWLMFGTEVWTLFLAQGGMAMETLREGFVGWNKMISTYSMFRIAGFSDTGALAIQSFVSLVTLAAVFRAWRPGSGVSMELRGALLLTGALLATPFGLNYDLYILAPAIAMVAARGMAEGFEPWQKTLLAVVYAAPFAILWLMADRIAIAPFVLAAFFAHLYLTALDENRASGANPATIPAE